jgi:PKD repeat protein
MDRGILPAAVTLAAALVVSACSVDQIAPPSISGPSEFGLSINMTAAPDQLPRDGSSRSVVTVRASDAQGRPVVGQRLSLSLSPTSVTALSATDVTTDRDGRATFAVAAPSLTTVVPNNRFVIAATPVGDNSANAAPRIITIMLVGTSNATLPVPAFTWAPQTPEFNKLVTLDATATTDEGVRCMDECTYTWDFDDGTGAIGRIVTHVFAVARAHNVLLTVTDAAGSVVDLRQLVNIVAPAAPTVSLAVAPSPPVVNQLATFTATATASAGHAIQRYDWNFGDGTTASTSLNTATKTYGARGVFAVTVRATDDIGLVGSAGLVLDMTTGTPTGITASFTISPSNPRPGDTVNFNAASSTPSNGATVTEYRWDWGDGTETTASASPIAQHVFGSIRSYVVRLTVTDSQGRIAITTQPLVVVAP